MSPPCGGALITVALGGNALCPPAGDLSFDRERESVSAALAELALLAEQGARLLVVHGNGPQVGRLLAAPGYGAVEHLDLHVAQTQGELGYLVAAELDRRLRGRSAVAVLTRVLVDGRDAAFAHPAKPVGPVLRERRGEGPFARTANASGWRRVVASPRPLAVVEIDAVRALLSRYHVVAGGGGGIAVSESPAGLVPCAAVVDKDWTAALLATELGAAELVYVTDVAQAFDAYGSSAARPIGAMTAPEAESRLERGVFAAGSMEPKVASAVAFVTATGRAARITAMGRVLAALRGEAGTVIAP